MQKLTYVKTQNGFELYCETCDNLFDEQFVQSNTKYFMKLHRYIHKEMGLDTPDFEENEELSGNSNEFSTDLSTEIT